MNKIASGEQNKPAGLRGASVSKASSSDRFKRWLLHHQFSAIMSLKKIFAEPFSSFMTWLVIGIALALPTSLFLVVENVKSLGERWNGSPQISIYLHNNLSAVTILGLRNKLEQMSGVDSVEYVSPDAALASFKERAGFSEAIQSIDENPLPPVYVIKPSTTDTDALSTLTRRLQGMPEVEFVQLDLDWVKKLQQIVTLAEQAVFLLGALLSLGVLLTIGNTIGLAIENRKEEIVVVKLVGGTDAFVRRPLLYSGLWCGLMGGVVAWLLIVWGSYVMSGPAHQLAILYQSDFSPQSLSFTASVSLLLVSATLGLAGAWFATARYLHKIQPR